MPTTGDGIGTSPFGVGTPASAAAPPTDPPGMVRYINPSTRKPEISSVTGHFKTMPKTRQRVLIIMMTIRGSSSVLRDFGLGKPDKVIVDTIQAEMEREVNRAFDDMVRIEKAIRIDDVIVEPGDFGRVAVTLVYTDLTIRQTDQRVTV